MNKINKHFDDKSQKMIYTGGNLFSHLNEFTEKEEEEEEEVETDPPNISLETTSSSSIHGSWASQMEDELQNESESDLLSLSDIELVAHNTFQGGTDYSTIFSTILKSKEFLDATHLFQYTKDYYKRKKQLRPWYQPPDREFPTDLFRFFVEKDNLFEAVPALSRTELHKAAQYIIGQATQIYAIYKEGACPPCKKELDSIPGDNRMDDYQIYDRDDYQKRRTERPIIEKCLKDHWVRTRDLLPIEPTELWEKHSANISYDHCRCTLEDYITHLNEEGLVIAHGFD